VQRQCFRCINRPQRLLSKTRQRLSYRQTCQWYGRIVFQDGLVLFLDPAGEGHLLAVEIPKSVILETETASAMASMLAPPKPWAMNMAIAPESMARHFSGAFRCRRVSPGRIS